MNRTVWTLLIIVVGLALVAVPALAQRGPAGAPKAGGPRAGGPPVERPPLTAEHIEQMKKMHALHSEIQAAQLDLLSLRHEQADEKKIDAKNEEIIKLRVQAYEMTLRAQAKLGHEGRGRFGRGSQGWGGGRGGGNRERSQQGWRGGGRGGQRGAFGGGRGRGGGQGFGGRGPGGPGPGGGPPPR